MVEWPLTFRFRDLIPCSAHKIIFFRHHKALVWCLPLAIKFSLSLKPNFDHNLVVGVSVLSFAFFVWIHLNRFSSLGSPFSIHGQLVVYVWEEVPHLQSILNTPHLILLSVCSSFNESTYRKLILKGTANISHTFKCVH